MTIEGHRSASVAVVREPPQISCIITSFNNGEELRRALRSVLGQTLLPQEIIIADDHSSAPQRQAALALEDRSRGVRVIAREQNLGPGENRHQAILEASQPFITTLDGDDQFAPGKLEAEWRVLSGRTDAIACSDIGVADAGSFTIRPVSAFTGLDPEERLRASVQRSAPLPRDMLYSKDIYLTAGGYERSACLYEDWSLKLALTHRITDWRRAPAVGTIYHRHERGLSAAPRATHMFWKTYVIARNVDWLAAVLGARFVMDALFQIWSRHDDAQSRRRADHAATAMPAGAHEGEIDLSPLTRLAARNLRGASSAQLAEELAVVLAGFGQLSPAL